MTAKGFFIGLLVGGIVGAGTALLFAPMEGSEARKRISDTSKSTVDKVGQMASSVKQRVKRQREQEVVEQAI
ncbi:MAG: YtxH domain-containing protein [Armatimonadota bacterium]|jgi:gas vesicle protein